MGERRKIPVHDPDAGDPDGAPFRAGPADDARTGNPSVPVTSVAAVVNTHVITIQAVEQFGARAVEAARRQYLARPEQFLQRRQEILRDSLEQLVERFLILDEFTSSGFNLPESIINDVVASQIREEFGDRLTLMKTLRRVGESYEDFRNDQRDAFIITQMTLKNVNQNIFISPRRLSGITCKTRTGSTWAKPQRSG